MRARLWVPVVLCLSLWSVQTVQAEGPRRPGTRRILEVTGGTTLSGGTGPALGARIGRGATLKGTPIRAYVIGGVDYGVTRRLDEGGARDERRDLSLGAGARLYIGLPDRLRLHAEVLFGTNRSRSEMWIPNGPKAEAYAWTPQLSLAGGLAYRVLYELSLGVGVRWMWSRDGLSDLREARGEEPLRPVSVLAGATWHF